MRNYTTDVRYPSEKTKSNKKILKIIIRFGITFCDLFYPKQKRVILCVQHQLKLVLKILEQDVIYFYFYLCKECLHYKRFWLGENNTERNET